MLLNEVLNKLSNDNLDEETIPKEKSKESKTYFDYLQEVNEETGKPYIIPMLSKNDPDYCNQYVSMMKFKEMDPETFQKILNWE